LLAANLFTNDFFSSSLLDTSSREDATILRIARSPNRNAAAGSDNPADCATDNPCGLLGDGGAGRDRTDDILLAKQALSQLSYGP
jgi:hypothetical protein